MLAIDLACALLLAFAALAALIAAAGVLRSRNTFAALHCSAAAAILVPILALLAVIVRAPLGQPTLQMLVVALVLIAGAPVTSHVIGMAEYRRRPRS